MFEGSDNMQKIIKVRKTKETILNEKINKALKKAEDDIEHGRVKDADEVFKEWEEIYGI